MVRISLALAALIVGVAAGPVSSVNAVVPKSAGAEIVARMESVRPVPPTAFTAAPMPNPDIDAPNPYNPTAGQPTVAPTIVSNRPGYRGEGFVPGSVGTPDVSKKMTPSPGVNLNVPLQ
jgi:hypothetical protein